MRVRRWLTTWVALLLVASLIVVYFDGNATGDETKKSALPATASQVSTTEGADVSSADVSSADVNSAEMAVWRKNIAQWKKWEPGEPADNSFCNVCHADLEDEKLVQIHLPEGVGCETCHGISDKHSEDEDSLIPPDVLFAKSKISFYCVECHDQDELIESESEHKDLFAAVEKAHDPAAKPKANGKKQKTCTDCHEIGHKLKHRTRRWNKTTRKLEWYDGVRMMQSRDQK
jgi:Doubled CXXCH motif (Paired_CXXCH_1)